MRYVQLKKNGELHQSEGKSPKTLCLHEIAPGVRRLSKPPKKAEACGDCHEVAIRLPLNQKYLDRYLTMSKCDRRKYPYITDSVDGEATTLWHDANFLRVDFRTDGKDDHLPRCGAKTISVRFVATARASEVSKNSLCERCVSARNAPSPLTRERNFALHGRDGVPLF